MGEDQEDDDAHPAKDRIIDSRNFEMGGGIDLGAFLSDDSLESAKKPARVGSSPTDATAGALSETSPSEEIDEAGETRWGISYETLVAPLVASIKELKARIEVLEGN